MPVTSIEERRRDRPLRAARRVVAVILEDGTVRSVDQRSETGPGTDPFATGHLAGPDWVLWWERRNWSDR